MSTLHILVFIDIFLTGDIIIIYWTDYDKRGIILTEKELRKLKRYQLLELLIIQIKQTEELQSKLEQIEAQYNDQKIRISRLGSIAEASVKISGVFEAAQKAADIYIENAKKQADQIIHAAQLRAEEIENQAKNNEQISHTSDY